MSVHPEDAAIYADELHRDLAALTAQLKRIADVLEDATCNDGEPFRVSQSGAWSVTSYAVTP